MTVVIQTEVLEIIDRMVEWSGARRADVIRECLALGVREALTMKREALERERADTERRMEEAARTAALVEEAEDRPHAG